MGGRGRSRGRGRLPEQSGAGAPAPTRPPGRGRGAWAQGAPQPQQPAPGAPQPQRMPGQPPQQMPGQPPQQPQQMPGQPQAWGPQQRQPPPPRQMPPQQMPPQQMPPQQPVRAQGPPMPLGAGVAGPSGMQQPQGQPQEPRPGAGRAAFRGAAGDVGDVTRAMGDVSVGERSGSGGGQGQENFQFLKNLRYLDYDDIRTKPAHIENKTGTSGKPISLRANYFELQTRPNYHLYQYHVKFDPPVDSKRLKMAMMHDHAALLGSKRAFDGMILYTVQRLEKKETDVYSMRRYDSAKIRINIVRTAEVPTTSPQFVQVANIQFRKVLSMIGMHQIGRHYFDVESATSIPNQSLHLIPGFMSAIKPHEDGLLLGLDVAHKVCRVESAFDVMQDFTQRLPRNQFQDECTRQIVGCIVLTKYNNRTYRVDDIDFGTHPSDSFELKNGDKITFLEYYKKHHNIDIRHPEQPMLMSKPKTKDVRSGQIDNIYLVPELCYLTGLTESQRADNRLMKDVSSHTRVTPDKRISRMEALVQRMKSNRDVDDLFDGWELVFKKDLLKIDARQAPQEVVKMFRPGPGKVHSNLTYRQEMADWGQDLKGKHMIVSIPLTKWFVVVLDKQMNVAQELVQCLMNIGPPMNFMIDRPTFIKPLRDHNDMFKKAIKENVTEATQMVMIMVPSYKKDRYDAIKKTTCLECPVPSQVVVSTTLTGGKGGMSKLRSVATKIAIQLNCKLGGEPWVVEIPLKDTMMIGIDTYHDSAMKNQSVVGFVSSQNPSQSRYWVEVTIQGKHEELANCLTSMVTIAVEKYKATHGHYPARYVVYRDGVGDGQLRSVFEHEMPQVRDALKAILNTEPWLGWVVVKKRIMTRFFSTSNGNPPPGTIVDTKVTNQLWYDFFLISQSVRQGTVSPTHYNCIWDCLRLKPDQLQRLTYKLTHLYYNWPGTIRVPAPCQYAHKLAFLVGQSLHTHPSPSLCNRLFFL